MDLHAAITGRQTTNGPFRPDPVRREDQRRLMEAAARAPSHFNSQPWRFVLVEDRATIEAIADHSGAAMARLMEEGTFWSRYLRYFRFTDEEMERTGDGIHFDHLPKALKPFRKHLFGSAGQSLMNRLGVPRTLGDDNRRLVAGSPLLLATLLDRTEYRPGELSGFYSVVGLGAAIENVWLTAGDLGMGIQFVSTPMEFPERWEAIGRLLEVPDELALMAVFRLGYLPADAKRPTIDWSSRHRKRFAQYVSRDRVGTPAADLDVERPVATEVDPT
jgi:nitroreductase